jgi:hypothetical protein
MAAPFTNPPAVAEAVPTSAPEARPNPNGSEPGVDVTSWKLTQRTAGDVTYSYRYPANWSADLAYCAPGAARTASGSELPARCASTDILVGQKARDVGVLTRGDISRLIIDGKEAVRQVDSYPRNGMASRIYTVLLYDDAGEPIVGFSTAIGPGSDEATQNSITATLDKIAATITVGR